MKQKVAVANSGNISASQMKEFWRKVEDGTIDGERFQAFLENPKKFSKGLTIVRAINILGTNKVITAEATAKAWGMEAPKSAAIRYSEEILCECANENQSGKSDWRLVYINGLSLREQREKRGTDKTKQPCFYNNDWWLQKPEDSWATKKPEAGYYLINFCGQFASMNWQAQEAEIAKLGSGYERCHETIFAEAILTIYMVNNGERIAENWYHWSALASSGGYRVVVGFFDSNGLGVGGFQASSVGHFRVALARKFAF
ncbi:hypothetical protein JW977_04540 [Candidatus Falkowbacteria bacterium]|nr:hypothetical protein [Candidatus Falkowbacteria bacterium]